MTSPQHPGDAHGSLPPQQPHFPAQQPQIPGQQQPQIPGQQWQAPGGQLPTGDGPASPPSAGTNRTVLIVAAAAVVALFVLSFGGYAVWDRFIKEDTGVAACKAMRDGKNVDGSEDTSNDDTMTEKEYRAAREMFEDSRHDDIEEHGTALMDVAWQVSQLPKGQEMGALAYMGPLSTHMSGLQTACADQGVILNLNKR